MKPSLEKVQCLTRLFCALAVPEVTSAQGASFIYEVPEGCPTRAEFVAQVAAKCALPASSVDQLNDSLAALRIVRERDYTAHLVFHPQHGTDRYLSATTCHDVVAGAALVVALGLTSAQGAPDKSEHRANVETPSGPGDPLAATADEPAGYPNDNVPELPAPPPNPVVPVATPSVENATKPPYSQRAPVDVDWASAPNDDAARARASFQLGGSGGFNTWVAPGLVAEGRLFAQLESLDTHWAVRAVGYRSLGSAELDGRRAHFDVWGGRVDFSPYLLGALPTWRLALAGVLDVGALRARGDADSKLATANAQRFWWVAPGIVARLATPEWFRVRVELQGEALVPLRRPQFNFERPFEAVHTPAAVDFGAHLAIAVRVH